MTAPNREAVEAAAIVNCNMDEDLSPDNPWGARLINNSRDAEHRGDCTKEPFTCCRCLYINETKRAEAALTAAVPFLAPQPSDEESAEAMRAKCEEIVRDGAGQSMVGSSNWVRITRIADDIAALKGNEEG